MLENVINTTANGTHYSSKQFFPTLTAIIGLGEFVATNEGQLVAFEGIETFLRRFCLKAVVRHTTPIPEGIGAGVAAALPSATLTFFLPLK